MAMRVCDLSGLTDLQRRLLDWFGRAARDLPWRCTRDPYHILVSEMMLQQTQVDRVVPRYAAFLEAFPTLAALADAPTADVIRQWAGLGYNRRAVNVQRAARVIVADYGGVFPQQVEDLRRLPGVGPYTAGAVACFAFEQDVAFLDTNMRRVVRRCLVGPDDRESLPRERDLLELAQSLIPSGRGWWWNQAVMELGALVCTATAPACERCPLRGSCRAYAAWDAQRVQQEPEGQDGTPGDKPVSYLAPRRSRPARQVAERKAPFVGSKRYYRGRVVAALRDLPPGEALPLEHLGPLVKEGYDSRDSDEVAWLIGLVAGLVRDGLVEQVAEGARLPG